MSKTVADYLGTMCPGPLPRTILADYAKVSGFVGLLFCGRCLNMVPLSEEGAAMVVRFGRDIYGPDFNFDPLTHYIIASNCPNCDEGTENTQTFYGTAKD
jgi:hypothetical protein